MKIYADCVRYYPFVLGAQPVRMIDLAAFYAAVANEGADFSDMLMLAAVSLWSSRC